jgi:hypothetical protein
MVTTTVNNAEARDLANLLAGEIYWKQAVAAKVITTTSADELGETVQSDYDGNGTLETTAVSQTRIDGSIVTTVIELNASKPSRRRASFPNWPNQASQNALLSALESNSMMLASG